MARIIIRGPLEKEVSGYASKIGELLRAVVADLRAEVKILGPAPCLVTRLKANYRYNLQLTSADLASLQAVWHQAELQFPNHSTVEYQVDVEPLNFR